LFIHIFHSTLPERGGKCSCVLSQDFSSSKSSFLTSGFLVNSLLWACAAVMLRLITPCKGTQMPVNIKLWLHAVSPKATLNYCRCQHKCKIIWEEYKTRVLQVIVCYCRNWQHLGYLKQRWIDHLWSRGNAIQFTGRWYIKKYL